MVILFWTSWTFMMLSITGYSGTVAITTRETMSRFVICSRVSPSSAINMCIGSFPNRAWYSRDDHYWQLSDILHFPSPTRDTNQQLVFWRSRQWASWPDPCSRRPCWNTGTGRQSSPWHYIVVSLASVCLARISSLTLISFLVFFHPPLSNMLFKRGLPQCSSLSHPHLPRPFAQTLYSSCISDIFPEWP